MSNFTKRLNLLLNEYGEDNCTDEAAEIIRKLDNIRHQMLELQNQLSSIKKKNIGKFAIKTHQERPDLNIDVDDNKCRIGNGIDDCFDIEPNLGDQTWSIQNNNISGHINDILDMIFKHFRNIEEHGQIYINGQKSNMLLLSEWMNNKKIMSRKTKKAIL